VDKLGNVLPKVLARQPGAGRLTEARLQLLFRDLLGPDLSAACETVELRGSTMTVVTSNPALAHQLRLDSEQLLARLNQMGMGRRLKALRVRIGRGPGGPG
jgi:hypothetical protein